jgi:peptidoglycan/xylan/chitin deacetylase (PgdA/CDA1 family)
MEKVVKGAGILCPPPSFILILLRTWQASERLGERGICVRLRAPFSCVHVKGFLAVRLAPLLSQPRLKATLERGLVRSHLADAWRLTRRRDVLILAYHNIVPTGVEVAGDRSLHLTQAIFAAQLDSLKATHDVVPFEALFNPDAPRRRPRAIITFDDAYRGAVTVGLGEVVARGLAATVFVSPAFVGGRFFWWDLVTQTGAPGPTESFRKTALEECRGMDDAVRHLAGRSGYAFSRLPMDAACASEDELRAAAKLPGVTLASHTWSHPNLVRLQPSELEEELTRPLEWLGARFDNVVPVLSYPYGLTSTPVQRAAAHAGYRAGLLVTGGWTPSRPRNPFAVRRLNVPAGLSSEGFVLRTAGLL